MTTLILDVEDLFLVLTKSDIYNYKNKDGEIHLYLVSQADEYLFKQYYHKQTSMVMSHDMVTCTTNSSVGNPAGYRRGDGVY